MDPDFRGLFFLRRTALSKLATTQGLPNGPGIVHVHELDVDMVSVRLVGFCFEAISISEGTGRTKERGKWDIDQAELFLLRI